MSFHETAEDNMNFLATNILSCPKCGSENIEEKGAEYDEDDETTIWYMKCRDCEHHFEDSNTQHYV